MLNNRIFNVHKKVLLYRWLYIKVTKLIVRKQENNAALKTLLLSLQFTDVYRILKILLKDYYEWSRSLLYFPILSSRYSLLHEIGTSRNCFLSAPPSAPGCGTCYQSCQSGLLIGNKYYIHRSHILPFTFHGAVDWCRILSTLLPFGWLATIYFRAKRH